MADELADLRAKLRARKDKPGFAQNVAEIEAMILEAENAGFVWKQTQSNRFVSAAFAAANPATTYKVRVR